MQIQPSRIRAGEEIGPSIKLGEYFMCVASGSLTTVAAATATAGHIFALRNVDTAKKCYIRYLALQATVTTGFTSGQEVAFDAVVARSFSASYTGGTAIDMGGTVTTANHLRGLAPTSILAAGDCRIGGSGALTAGTQTLDPNPIAQVSAFAATTTAGALFSRVPGGSIASGIMIDATQGDMSPLVLGNNEGLILRNVVLMGAAGVLTLRVWLGWDEGTP